MAEDKEIIAMLLDALENAYIDTTIFRAMLMTICENRPELGDWEPVFDNLRAENQQDVKQKFSALRQAVAQSRDVEQALRQFLEDTPPKGPVH
jgi:predicted outer membrane protein